MIYDRSIFDTVFAELTPWRHDVCRSETKSAYSYLTRFRMEIDDVHQIDGKWYFEINGLISEPYDTFDEAEQAAIALLQNRGEDIFDPVSEGA